mmetsp:Transcript_24994/g.89194  ORF Transcript_24994/g.89194 Transcript_24994/m.89194 type:complete len:344 (+) Transcript_24994:1352-2383(+)
MVHKDEAPGHLLLRAVAPLAECSKTISRLIRKSGASTAGVRRGSVRPASRQSAAFFSARLFRRRVVGGRVLAEELYEAVRDVADKFRVDAVARAFDDLELRIRQQLGMHPPRVGHGARPVLVAPDQKRRPVQRALVEHSSDAAERVFEALEGKVARGGEHGPRKGGLALDAGHVRLEHQVVFQVLRIRPLVLQARDQSVLRREPEQKVGQQRQLCQDVHAAAERQPDGRDEGHGCNVLWKVFCVFCADAAAERDADEVQPLLVELESQQQLAELRDEEGRRVVVIPAARVPAPDQVVEEDAVAGAPELAAQRNGVRHVAAVPVYYHDERARRTLGQFRRIGLE